MEVVRKFVDADSLMSILSLPEAFRNRKLEVIVLPAEERVERKEMTDVKLAVQALVGAIPNENMTLEEYREERLKKYEAFD